MSALTVVETDLACDRAKNHSRQSLGHPIGRSVAPGKISPKTVSYPRIHRARVSTPPRALAAPAAPAAPANDAKHSHSLVYPPPARPSARQRAPTRAHARAREIRYESAPDTHPRRATPPRRAARPRVARALEKIRTWILVALKAATRPTKEEARRADIVEMCVCRNADRAREIARSTAAIDGRDRPPNSTRI